MSDLDATMDAAIEAIEAAIKDQCPVWEETFDAGPGLVVGVRDAAVVAVRATAEVLRPAITRQALTEAAHDFGQYRMEWWPEHVANWLRDRASRVGSDIGDTEVDA